MLSEFIIDYDANLSKFKFKRYKVTFNKDGQDFLLFTEDLEYANSYSKNMPGINNFHVSELGVIVAYDERLTQINALSLDPFIATSYLNDINKFILTGLIEKDHQVVALRDLREAFIDKARDYYLNEAIELLKKVRQEKQLGGVYYNSFKISSTPDDINIIKGTYEQIKNGFITYVDFKVSPTEFIRLEHDRSLEILLIMQSHTQACFTTEQKLQTYLKTLSLEDLQLVTIEDLNPMSDKNKINIKSKFLDYYKESYDGIYNKLNLVKNKIIEEYNKAKQGAE